MNPDDGKNHCSLEPDFGTTHNFSLHTRTRKGAAPALRLWISTRESSFFRLGSSYPGGAPSSVPDSSGKHFSVPCTVERDHGSANHNLRASGKFNFSSETSYTTCASRDSEQEHRGDRARNFCNQMNGMVVLFSPAFDVRVSGLVQPASQQSLYYLCCSCS